MTAEIEGDEKNLIVGAKYGIARLDPETGKLDYLRKVWNEQDGSDKPRLYVMVFGIKKCHQTLLEIFLFLCLLNEQHAIE